MTSDLYCVRRQILNLVSVSSNDRPRLFLLNLRPCTDLPTNVLDQAFPFYTNRPLATCLNPDVFVRNLIDNYS